MATAIPSRQISESPGEPCAWPAFESMHETVRGARATVASAGQAAQGLAAATAAQAKTHPLRTAGVAMLAGAALGSLIGFGLGWVMRNRT